jgi:hypothetical protein
MTATREDLSGLELALSTAESMRFASELDAKDTLIAIEHGLSMLVAEAQSAEPVQGEAVALTVVDFKRLEQHSLGYTERLDVLIESLNAHFLTQHNRLMAAALPDAELVEVLTDACADLKAYIDAEYPAHMLEYPHNQRKRESDMGVVNRIDAKLAELQSCSPAE